MLGAGFGWLPTLPAYEVSNGKEKATKKSAKNIGHASFVLTRIETGYTVGGLVLDGEAVELDLKTNEFSDRQKAQDAVTKWLKAKGYKVESIEIHRR